MATRGSSPIALGPFMGLWVRADIAPADHFVQCGDAMFNHETVYPRTQFVEIRSLGARPLRIVPFKLSSNPVQSRWLVLAVNPGGGSHNVYDVTVGGPSTLIISGLLTVSATDMSVVVVYDRAYISFHDRVNGSQAHPVHVWDPATMAVARFAAGLEPIAPLVFTVVVSATNGNIEPGLHILAVGFESNTGHVTPPGLYGSITAPGGTKKKLDLTAIPLGPTGTVARHIFMSKVVNNFDGNFRSPRLFYALRIADNLTTAMTGANGLDVYDTQLIADADYLKSQRETIPSGVGMCMYASRLVVGNVNIPLPSVPNLPPLPPKAERSLIIGSTTNDLESFSQLDGFRQISKSEGGGIKQMSEVNGILYARKSFMTFALQDNGQEINKWPISQLDVAGGTEAHGIATFPGTSAGSTKGVQVVADRSGLYVFDGVYQPRPLTWKVEEIWRTIDPGRFAEIMVSIDPERNRLAVLLPPHVDPFEPFTVTTTSRILYGDFTFGLDPDNIRWSYWKGLTGFDRDLVGLNFDYRDSLKPSLTITEPDPVLDAGKIYDLPDDLNFASARHTPMILIVAVPLHPDGGKGTVVVHRHRLCQITSLPRSIAYTVYDERHLGDPNPWTIVPFTPSSSPGFQLFKNDLHKVGKAHIEVAYLRFSTGGWGLTRIWVFHTSEEAES